MTTTYYSGAQLTRLVSAVFPAIDAYIRDAGKKRIKFSMDKYVDAQPSGEVRDSVRVITSRVRWKYVPFGEFRRNLEKAFAKLERAVSTTTGGEGVCFVIDSLKKSSFWMLSLLFYTFEERLAAMTKRLQLVVARNGADEGLRRVSKGSCFVLVDDAVYSGEQLSTFYLHMRAATERVLGTRGAAAQHFFIMAPYMSRHSLKLFSGARTVYARSFGSILEKLSSEEVIRNDLILDTSRHASLMTYPDLRFQSLFFGVMDILPVNTPIVFEHKMADALSIPYQWLTVGPCVPVGIKTAYKFRADKVEQLVSLVTESAQNVPAYMKNNLSTPWLVSMYVTDKLETMSAPARDAFLRTWMTRVDLQPAPAPPAPANNRRLGATFFSPLLSPGYCSPAYEEFVTDRLRWLRDDGATLRERSPASWTSVVRCERVVGGTI